MKKTCAYCEHYVEGNNFGKQITACFLTKQHVSPKGNCKKFKKEIKDQFFTDINDENE